LLLIALDGKLILTLSVSTEAQEEEKVGKRRIIKLEGNWNAPLVLADKLITSDSLLRFKCRQSEKS
jgi:hypothetical protein